MQSHQFQPSVRTLSSVIDKHDVATIGLPKACAKDAGCEVLPGIRDSRWKIILKDILQMSAVRKLDSPDVTAMTESPENLRKKRCAPPSYTKDRHDG